MSVSRENEDVVPSYSGRFHSSTRKLDGKNEVQSEIGLKKICAARLNISFCRIESFIASGLAALEMFGAGLRSIFVLGGRRKRKRSARANK